MQSLAGVVSSPALLRCALCSQSNVNAASSSRGGQGLDGRAHFSELSFRRVPGNLAPVLKIQKLLIRASTGDEQTDPPTTSTATTADSDKETLTAKLAAAEAEAEALKRELALRRGVSKDSDLAKLKPATPDKRIDGTGFRETIFSVPSQSEKKSGKKWGLTEAELFMSKGAPTEGRGLQGEAMEEGAEKTITRRLIGGLGVTAVVSGLAFVKLPAILSKPAKPLFFYLTYILRLRDTLESLENTGSDAKVVESQLARAYGSPEELKGNFLSAASLLEGGDADRATTLSYDIFDYLFQANSSRYFDDYGQPTATQQADFLKFSLNSIKAARLKIQEFIKLVPADALDAANMQLSR